MPKLMFILCFYIFYFMLLQCVVVFIQADAYFIFYIYVSDPLVSKSAEYELGVLAEAALKETLGI